MDAVGDSQGGPAVAVFLVPDFRFGTVVEQKLFVMYLEHRMRTFQGTFHASPDYALWYGWSEMQRDLTEIKELAAQMRREKQGATLKPATLK